jgi:hypothetical protein
MQELPMTAGNTNPSFGNVVDNLSSINSKLKNDPLGSFVKGSLGVGLRLIGGFANLGLSFASTNLNITSGIADRLGIQAPGIQTNIALNNNVSSFVNTQLSSAFANLGINTSRQSGRAICQFTEGICNTAQDFLGNETITGSQFVYDLENGILEAEAIKSIIEGGAKLLGGGGNSVQFSDLAKPSVEDPKLQNLVNDLYKGKGSPNQLGSGSTADAIRNEIATGHATENVFHAQKGEQYLNALNNWLGKNPSASAQDIDSAQKLLNDLKDSLGK